MSRTASARDDEPAITATGRRRPRRDGESVWGEIYEAILDHRLPPGTKLTEDSLAAALGVSRTTVRTALVRLAEEKIVIIRRNRGARVASPTPADTREVFQARRVVEDATVRAAVRAATPAQCAALARMVSEENAALARGDRRTWIRLTGRFHLRIAEIAGNSVLADFLKELVSRTSLIIALYQAPGQPVCAPDDHAGLAAAMERGDEDQAARLMRAHLDACERQLNLEIAPPPLDVHDVFHRLDGP